MIPTKMKRQKDIISMFDKISERYDILNHILTIGIDRKWRRESCKLSLKAFNNDHIEYILDVACGTGDMCLQWIQVSKFKEVKINKIIGIDPSERMIKRGQDKISGVDFIRGSASYLPFKNDFADILSISFGLRNITDRKEALKEFFRVLKQNGLLVVLEFLKIEESSFRSRLIMSYIGNILPFIGGLISKDYDAYLYLATSIQHFITPQLLLKEIESSGFRILLYKRLSMSISTLIVAKKEVG